MGAIAIKTLTSHQSIWLEQHASLKEVKQAGSKAPRSNDFTFAFYKKEHTLIGMEIVQLVNEFLKLGKLLKGVNTSYKVPRHSFGSYITLKGYIST